MSAWRLESGFDTSWPEIRTSHRLEIIQLGHAKHTCPLSGDVCAVAARAARGQITRFINNTICALITYPYY